eukprot:TRINITY_DN24183_c0_g1_i1.p1 TRINITY_DN24183_c0_g1~~TRINITY_DN24183_c0_g1_i1.p1  ORF type:complete len:120 (-),score=7.59 TRINITY_DN24183_c0_g1_i1:7-366(-)
MVQSYSKDKGVVIVTSPEHEPNIPESSTSQHLVTYCPVSNYYGLLQLVEPIIEEITNPPDSGDGGVSTQGGTYSGMSGASTRVSNIKNTEQSWKNIKLCLQLFSRLELCYLSPLSSFKR